MLPEVAESRVLGGVWTREGSDELWRFPCCGCAIVVLHVEVALFFRPSFSAMGGLSAVPRARAVFGAVAEHPVRDEVHIRAGFARAEYGTYHMRAFLAGVAVWRQVGQVALQLLVTAFFHFHHV